MEEMKQEKKINKNIVFSIVAVILLVVVVIGATVAYFSAQAQTELQTVTTADLALGFTNGDIVNATNIVPIADSEIKTKATELPFSVTNEGGQHAKITISLTDITISDELKDIDFRWGLFNADTGVGLNYGVFKDIGTDTSMIIYQDVVIDAADPDITKNYILRVWIHDDGALQNYMQGKSFSAKVTVDGEAVEYTDEDCFTMDGNTIVDYNPSCGTDVVIPKSVNGVTVTKIGDNSYLGYYEEDTVGAFENKGLTSVIIPNTVKTIDSDSDSSTFVFGNNNLKNVTIPESVTEIGENEFYSAGIETLALHENINEAGGFSNNNITHVTIPTKTSTGLYYNNPLTSVVIMEGVKTIGPFAFTGSKSMVTSIEIPSSVTKVENDVFTNNKNLTEIVVRGKTRLSDFVDQGLYLSGLTANGGLPKGVNFIFRP